MSELHLENLVKKFGEVVAVDDLSIMIKKGELVALLGPSGCGKTTALLMIAGIYKPTKGKIFFDDIVVNNVLPKDRGVGLVFQSYALYPHMTAFDNIAFPLKFRKIPKEEIKKRVLEVARFTRIGALLERKPAQLSGGEQQRVALCRALVKNPRVLLLDEPLSNLDARLRIETRVEIARLQKELGITTILVTHDQVEAMAMADRIAVMDKGRLQQVATAEELYNKPANLFVASFIGSPPMNFLEVMYQRDNGRPVLRNEYVTFDIPQKLAQKIEMNNCQKPLLGFRPEDVALSLSLQEHKNSFPAKVFLIESVGGANVLVSFKSGNLLFRILAPANFSARLDDTLWIAPQMDKLHLFHQETGEAL
ncbi:ABC transporter ATP-binding protein [Dehalococcoidia bacterium]|nr:ABC transporter ATP-binding protein [Dehalococcoidia bacterium]